MPIKGLTDNPQAKMPRLGQLRKGAKKTNPKKPGEDLTYFRFVCNDPAAVEDFNGIYGSEPRAIHVFLAFNTIADTFPTWQEEHGAGGMRHRCDGETMILWQDESGLYHTEPKDCPYRDLPKGSKERKCKAVGDLWIFIPKLDRRASIQVVTGSIWDCLELTENLLDIEEVAQQASLIAGRAIGLRNIPCILTREPRMVSTPPSQPGGKRARREKWLLHLQADPAYVRMLMEATRRFALPMVDLPQIEAPDIELDYPVENGDAVVDAEVREVETPEEEAPEEPENGKGKKYFRPDFVKRIREILAKAKALGGTKVISERVLESATIDELKRLGIELRQYLDELIEQQASDDRPRNPADLRLWLHGKCGGDDRTPATEKQVPFVARKFQEAFAPDEDARDMYHDSLEWLTGQRSAKGLTKVWAKAILDWLLDPSGPDESGDTPLHPHAVDEARRVWRQVQAEIPF
jgi:hypothetical protein